MSFLPEQKRHSQACNRWPRGACGLHARRDKLPSHIKRKVQKGRPFSPPVIFNLQSSMRTVVLLVGCITVASARCGIGLIQGPASSDCYKFVSATDSWYSAEWQCGKLGGHLASVGSAFASTFLKSEVPSWCSGDYWLGGSNDDRTATWAWTDGTLFSYKNWDASKSTYILCSIIVIASK